MRYDAVPKAPDQRTRQRKQWLSKMSPELRSILAESLRFLQDAPLRLGPIMWDNWHAAFAAALLARCLAMLWLLGMPDPGAAKIRGFTHHIGVNRTTPL